MLLFLGLLLGLFSGEGSLTIGKEAKGKTGIEDSSLNLTCNTIQALNVLLTLLQLKKGFRKICKDLLE